MFTEGGDCSRWDNCLQMHYVLCCHKKKKKVAQEGERWSPWKQALFEKLMQWGVPALVRTDPAEEKRHREWRGDMAKHRCSERWLPALPQGVLTEPAPCNDNGER